MEKTITAFGHHKQRHLIANNPFPASKVLYVARSFTDAAQLAVFEKLIAGKGGPAQSSFDKAVNTITKQFAKDNPSYTKVPVVGRSIVEAPKAKVKVKAKAPTKTKKKSK